MNASCPLLNRLRREGAAQRRNIVQKTFIRYLSLQLIYSFFSLAAGAQEPGIGVGQLTAVLTGRVTDSTRAVIPGATIIVRATATGIERTLTTDAEGNFRIENLDPGLYKLVARGRGLAEKTQEIRLVAGQTFDLQIALNPPGVVEAVEVVARGSEVSTAAKTDTPLVETPQSVSVITRERLIVQSPLNLQEALRYTAGVNADPYGLDSRGDWAVIRGGEEWGQYLNGLRLLFGYNNNVRPDPFAIEQIEVLRGPSSVLYGQGSFNGVVNLVSKKPLATQGREVSLQFGSFGRKQAAFDLTGAMDARDNWLYRVIALGRDSGTQVDYVPDDRLLLAPSVTWRRGNATRLTVLGNFQRDEGGSSIGFFPWRGTLLPHPLGQIPTRIFIGEPDVDEYRTEQTSIGYLFEHKVGDRLAIRQNLNYTRSYGSIHEFYSRFPMPSFNDDQRTINRTLYVKKEDLDSPVVDTQLETRWRNGPIRHLALVGVDYQKAAFTGFTGSSDEPALDVFNPVYGNYTYPTLSALPKNSQSQTGIYAQDQIKIREHWVASLGLRKDWANSETAGDPASRQEDQAVTGRVGFVYLSGAGLAPYVNYSQSFQPVAGLDVYNQPYKPMRGKQVEAGVRYQPRSGNGLVSLAVFDMRQRNRLTNDPANPLNSIQVGEARIRGIELDANATVFWRLNLQSSYSYLDARVSKSNGPDLGKRLPTSPEHLAKFWIMRGFSFGDRGAFTVGGGVRHTGASWDGYDALKAPSFTLIDALLAYDFRTWRMAINVSNLTDKVYVATCLARGDCFYGLRRTVTANLSYRF
jgi:iron complex outermembrane recepter protein